MRSVPLVVRGKLRTTSLEVTVADVTTGLMRDETIRSVIVMEIVREMMVEIAGILGAIDLVVIFPLGGLAMRSSLSLILLAILGALGATGDQVEVEAMQHGHPLPVVVLQPRGILE